MRLAIFFPDNVLVDDHHYYTRDYRHYQFTELAKHFDATDFFVFTRLCLAAETQGLEVIDTDRINVVGLPGHCESKALLSPSGWERRILEVPRLLFATGRLFFLKRCDWDVLLLFDPYFSNLLLALLCLLFRKPSVFFVGARWDRNVILNSRYESWDRRLANHIKSLVYQLFIPFIVKRLPTAVTGQEIYDHYYTNGATFQKIFATTVHRQQIDWGVVQRRTVCNRPQRLINVCRLTPEKSLETLIEAMALLKQRNVSVHLTIVGPVVQERYREFLVDRVSELGVNDCIAFTGAINDHKKLLRLYADSDIFVLSSISEGSPKVIPEAMATGLPVVATRVGGLPELIQDGVNGILVEPRDAVALAKAIERLVSDCKMRESMGEASLRVAETFSLEVQMRRLADFIKRVVPQRAEV